MFTLITGLPGTGKSLYAVWELLRKIPGSTVKGLDGEDVQRVLYCNIDGLLLEHERIEKEDLLNAREWAEPGQVIAFDEVQDALPHVGSGASLPDVINWMSKHRHNGVDVVFMTQHPMLIDARLRRLVNRHIHLRRLGKTENAIVYEWDACNTNLNFSQVMSKAPWRYPKEGYDLYKSAELHTKPVGRLPALVWVIGIALILAAVMGYRFFTRTLPHDKPPTRTATEIAERNARRDAEKLAARTPTKAEPAPLVVSAAAAAQARVEERTVEELMGTSGGSCHWFEGAKSCSCFGFPDVKHMIEVCSSPGFIGYAQAAK